MVHDARKRVQADFAFSDAGVAVLARSKRVERIVQMHGLEPIESDLAVERFQNAVETAGDVVSGVPHVAGVEAHSQDAAALHAVYDAAQFAEVATRFAAFPRHRLEQDGRGDARAEDAV